MADIVFNQGSISLGVSDNELDVSFGGGNGGGVTSHSELTGLEVDDHLQYLTEERGDARYYLQSQIDSLLTSYPNASDGQEGQIPEIRNGVWSFVDNIITGNVSRTGEFSYNNTPGAIPGNSRFTVDNATPSLITWLRFDDSDNNNVDQTAFLVSLVKNGWLILIQNMTDSSQWVVFEVTGDSVDAGGYIEVPATFARDSGNWPVTNNTTCLVDFVARPSPSIYAAW